MIQLNSGDIIDASAGRALKFSVQNNGTVTLANYNSCGSLTTVGTTLTCSGVPQGTNYWQINSGALAPFVQQRIFVGRAATTSADFAFTGVDSTTPIASISAFTNGGNKNGLSLNASTATIQSLNNNTLTIGGNTTGNIALADNGITLTGSAPVIGSTNTLTINAFTLGGNIAAGTHNISNVGTFDLGGGNLSLSANTITSGSTLTLSGATTLSDGGLTTLTSASTLGVSATTLNLGNGSAAVLGTTSNRVVTLTPNGSGQLFLSSTYEQGVDRLSEFDTSAVGYQWGDREQWGIDCGSVKFRGYY